MIERLDSIQLFTQSRPQLGRAKTAAHIERFSWFELVILSDPNDQNPKDGMVWKSHANNRGVLYNYSGHLFSTEDSRNDLARIKSLLQVGIK
jgi:hypothetical protein